MTKQFRLCDLVHIKKDLPGNMFHFPNDKDAIITKYLHNSTQKGNDWEHSYRVEIKKLWLYCLVL